MKHTPREIVTQLAKSHLDRGDALGWFEQVYQVHRDNPDEIPWADFAPNDLLTSWLDANTIHGRACVVGCGLGDDAAALARHATHVTAFDLSPTAIQLAAKRFPNLDITWQAANLLSLPEAWHHAFDFIFEAYTLQSLPAAIRLQAFANIASLLAPGGKLIAVARLREATEPIPESPPWPLTRAELIDKVPEGLAVDQEDIHAPSNKHPARRIRVTYRRV